MSYWTCYEDELRWTQGDCSLFPFADGTDVLQQSREKFSQAGFSENVAAKLVSSGYVILVDGVVIDRYYGGALMSMNGRNRFSLEHFRELDREPPSRVEVVAATSLQELKNTIDRMRIQTERQLVFRGQTENYVVPRERANPFYHVEGIGEISLIPSFYRRLFSLLPNSFRWFEGLSLLEWSRIIYHGFDEEEIARRQLANNANGSWMHSPQDMEDSDDPLLHEFGRTRLDISMGIDLNLADLLGTLLQHYGLLSPFLDLSTDLDTALFFATNSFTQLESRSSYSFVGTNQGRSVLYVFERNDDEMHEYADHRVLDRVPPLRPKLQSCVICRSSPYAVNLAADFLKSIVILDFDLAETLPLRAEELFPTCQDDKFLSALKARLLHPEKIVEIV